MIVGGSRAGRKGISRGDSISGSGLRSGGSRGGFAGSLGRSRSIEPQALGSAGEEARPVLPLAGVAGGHVGVHEAQVGEGIAAIDHLAAIHLAAVLVDETGSQCSTTEDHRHIDARFIEGSQVVLHEGGGFHQQATHGDAIGVVLALGLDDRFHRLLDAEVDHLVAIVGEDDVDQVLADVVNVALDRGDQELRLGGPLAAFAPLELVHQRFEKRNR